MRVELKMCSISTLKNLHKKFNIPSVRDEVPVEVQDAAVLNAMADDPTALRGVDAVRSHLSALPKPVLVPRYVILTGIACHAAGFSFLAQGRDSQSHALTLS